MNKTLRPPTVTAPPQNAQDDSPAQTTFDGGLDAVVALWQRRRRALVYAEGEALAPLDVDLATLAATKIAVEPSPAGVKLTGYAAKRVEIAGTLQGRSELALLNGLVIANLRKRRWPAHAPALFQRIWVEQGKALLAELDSRWLISSAITFSDHGVNEPQRRTGQALAVLFSLMKLYEYERLYAGQRPEVAFGSTKRALAPLPMGMEPFSLTAGGLDVNLIAPIWEQARRDKVMAPLARQLLQRLDGDKGNLFRRLKLMRQERLALLDRKQERREKRAAKGLTRQDAGLPETGLSETSLPETRLLETGLPGKTD